MYADKTRSQSLIEEFRDAQKQLEQLQTRWETALTELENLRAVLSLLHRRGAFNASSAIMSAKAA